MSVTIRPATPQDYYKTLERLHKLREEYDSLIGEARTAFHNEHWAELKAYVEPPAINALHLHEILNQEVRLADALDCFWNAAIGEAHNQQNSTAFAVVSSIATGVAAIATRLRENAEKLS